ncbi:MAG: helix-hairpin-helix domain-containing protein [Bacteroidota bacterium]|nr:helix-hairpin-helix domain-containing protein [Bacteroidota bacterium]
MTNSDIADILKLYADLSELHDGNPFKIKSFAAASFRIDKMPEPLAGKNIEELENTEGIGKSIAAKIIEINTRESFKELDELLEATPVGVREMMKVKGIGPKKIAMIWKEMGVENIGELLYACKENRLAQAKGFGLKTQENVLKQIEFMFVSANKFHYAKALDPALNLLDILKQTEEIHNASFSGEIRRKMEILEVIELLISCSDLNAVQQKIIEHEILTDIKTDDAGMRGKYEAYPVKISFTNEASYSTELFKQTGSLTHVNKVFFKIGSTQNNFTSEAELYRAAKLGYIEPEMRESRGEIEKAANGTLPKLIEFTDLTGPLHNHSTWSDGLNTIAELAQYCKEKGYQYLGMADHSKSAFYAHGLSEEKVLVQQKEIAALNEKMGPDFKIFAGIESDILYDGSLDYENDILNTFDYVVASVHSVLKMAEDKAMSRLIRAIENPYTTILGHPTGRLLLMREGYPINHHKIIDACAANGVIIEINANPYRLDLDWRYIDYALKKNVKLSINPDAHEIAGFYDMFYGVEVARKGGLSKGMCLNTMSLAELDQYFKNRKP